ncbi:MAG: 1-(5-phosphoribosyl)-5-[(5-phosphoribosylamino)methylideneamino]imidazole-4-carboxamide isomerase [bacterium]
MKLIPAIDLQSGDCVRLLKGRKDKSTQYSTNPLEMARHWVDQGAERLHLVDLDGAFEEESANKSVIKEILREVSIPCQVGGGLRSRESVDEILSAGAESVIVGTAGIKDPALLENLVQEFGVESIYAGMDCRDDIVLTRGWEEASQYQRDEWVDTLESVGIGTVIYTDVERDGTAEGPDYSGTQAVLESSELEVIASGGIGSLDHIRKLNEISHPRLKGIIVGRALYEERFTLEQAQTILSDAD